MTARETSETPEGGGLVAVFRSQALEAQVTLLLFWFAVGAIVTSSLIASAPLGGADSWIAFAMLAAGEVMAFVILVRSQVVACRGGSRFRVAWLPPLVLVLAVLPMFWGFVPLAVVHAVIVVVLYYRALEALVICTALGLVVVMALPVGHPLTALGFVLEAAMLAVIGVAVTVLAVRVDRLYLTREVLARRQVDLERDRVARDLHDLMGRTLVAASLRNQTALRLLNSESTETAAMLERLHEMLSAGQVQLRALTNGPTISDLHGELAGAKTLCERVHIDLTVEVLEDPPGSLEALLGLVVRENITNVLKHSQASWCRVRVERQGQWVTLTVTNDGALGAEVVGEADVDTRLARAVEAAGGDAHQGLTSRGTYESTARIPVRELARSEASP